METTLLKSILSSFDDLKSDKNSIKSLYLHYSGKRRKVWKPHEEKAFEEITFRLYNWRKSGILISDSEYVRLMYEVFKSSPNIKDFTVNFLNSKKAYYWLFSEVIEPEDIELVSGVSDNKEYQVILNLLCEVHDEPEEVILDVFPDVFSEEFIKSKKGEN